MRFLHLTLFILGCLVVSERPLASVEKPKLNVSVGAVYDDNWLLSDGDEIATSAMRFDGDLELGWVSQRRQYYTEISATQQIFDDARIDDLLDWQATIGWSSERERSNFGIALDYQRESALLGGFENDGRVGLDQQRSIKGVDVEAVYQLTSRNTFSYQLTVQDVSFEAFQLANRDDYQIASLVASFQRENTPRLKMNLYLYADAFRSERDLLGLVDFEVVRGELRNENLLVGPGFGMSYEISSTLSFNGSINARYARFEQRFFGIEVLEDRSNTEEQYFGNFSLNKVLSRHAISLFASRSIQPTSSGELIERDSAGLRWRFEAGNFLDHLVDIRWFDDRFELSDDDREAFVASYRASRRLGEHMSLSIEYRLRQQQQPRLDLNALSHSVFATFSVSVGR